MSNSMLCRFRNQTVCPHSNVNAYSLLYAKRQGNQKSKCKNKNDSMTKGGKENAKQRNQDRQYHSKE